MIKVFKILPGKCDTNVIFNFEKKNIKIVEPGGII